MKKPTKHRRRQQARKPRSKIAAAIGSASGAGTAEAVGCAITITPAQGSAAGAVTTEARAFAIHAGMTKHGPRNNWGKLEYAQDAIAKEYPHGLAGRLPGHSRLTKKVNYYLTQDPDYRASYGRETVSRQTVMRALATLRTGKR